MLESFFFNFLKLRQKVLRKRTKKMRKKYQKVESGTNQQNSVDSS